ncbi:MAG TPA: ABC transporter substrate-binding protein [Burkholderiales bacterium]|nr:ABC transporter substrate-binding protein [Burkholderiales bacterium]
MKRIFQSLLVLAAWLPAFAAVSAELAPDELVRTTSREVIEILKSDKEARSGKKLLDLVDAKVLPHFDFTRMTRLAVGKNWRSATPEQQQSLVREFRTLLVRTYSSALATYKDQVIDVRPVKLNAGDTEVTVRTQVQQSGGQPVQIDYAMEKKSDGWKVFDVTVAGVSLVTNYRSTFDRQIAEGGIDGLIKSLADKNRSLEEGAPGKRAS